eukprot:g31131.t1
MILSASKAMRSQPASASCWTDLANVLLARWSEASPTGLTASLQVLPVHLMAAPNALRQEGCSCTALVSVKAQNVRPC